MWNLKTFKTRKSMEKFIKKNEDKFIFTEIFINNGYAVEYKPKYIVEFD